WSSLRGISNWIKNPPYYLHKINAIIFLNYKPINSTSAINLKYSNTLNVFFDLLSLKKTPFKIGFDSCSISGIVKFLDVNPISIEYCEAARFSAFLSEDLKMYPCSFMVKTDRYGDLRKNNILDIWHKNVHFKNNRKAILNNSCTSCKHYSICMGGCPFIDNISLCGMKSEQITSMDQ
ncbi:MAG: SPASM domain-containing protein, partial [Bacteroidales bacterium]